MARLTSILLISFHLVFGRQTIRIKEGHGCYLAFGKGVNPYEKGYFGHEYETFWDCKGNGNLWYLDGNTKLYCEKGGLEWNAKAGTGFAIGPLEHNAKVETKNLADPISFNSANLNSATALYAKINNKKCGFQWSSTATYDKWTSTGTQRVSGRQAKFDCGNTQPADPITVEMITVSPTQNPSTEPTKNPSFNPTISPTKNPSNSPTKNPTKFPTNSPTNNPSKSPSKSPTEYPSISPSETPTNVLEHLYKSNNYIGVAKLLDTNEANTYCQTEFNSNLATILSENDEMEIENDILKVMYKDTYRHVVHFGYRNFNGNAKWLDGYCEATTVSKEKWHSIGDSPQKHQCGYFNLFYSHHWDIGSCTLKRYFICNNPTG
eukprot:245526_1